MSLIELLKTEALRRGLVAAEAQIDPETAFRLVRDMPYQRASSRAPETLIREWRGTCSGKHYLLKDLFQELGLSSRVMACTHRARLDPVHAPDRLRPRLEQSGGYFVDVHNYLCVELPDEAGEMVVDATWPLSTRQYGLTVNERFRLGEDQQIACKPLQIWEIPAGQDPQTFKEHLLRENFTPEELDLREQVIRTLGSWMGAG